MRFSLFATFLVAPFICGCATGYTDSRNPILGFAGGYSETNGPGELIKVTIGSNAYTEKDQVSNYLIYRCAELAQKSNKPYFTMYTDIAHAVLDGFSTESNVFLRAGRWTGEVYMLYQDSDVPGAISTDEILRKYGPLVKGAGT